LRERLWRAENWCTELAALRLGRSRSPERTFDLAVATEYCEPDRGAALALYLEAARAGHEPARERARALATALGAHLILAEVSQLAGDLVAAGTAYLDAGLRELAIGPLQSFADAKPAGATMASEYTRLQRVGILIAFARGTKPDADGEIARCLETATVPAFLHAERIARLAGLTDRRAAVIAAARVTFPDDPQIAELVAARLFERGAVDELVTHYRGRIDRAASRTENVERLRATGVELIARGVQPGLGLRLLQMALENAYTALLPDITSHLAAWQLIWTHAKQQRSTSELVPLIVQAFTAPLPEDDLVYLARLGLEIAWRDVGDPLAAQPYAANLLDFVPDHPMANAFVEEVVPCEVPLPAGPAISFSKPPPRSMDDAPVKRSGPASTPTGRTSRADLLRPPVRMTKPATVPPPRAAALKRNTSPFPIAKRPANPEALKTRAERKVVPVDAVVELPTGGFFSTVLRDISTSGAFIVTKRPIEAGTIISLELRVPDPTTLTLTSHRVAASVARCTELGWGVAFVDASSALIAALEATAR
jgi:hypothetical protein